MPVVFRTKTCVNSKQLEYAGLQVPKCFLAATEVTIFMINLRFTFYRVYIYYKDSDGVDYSIRLFSSVDSSILMVSSTLQNFTLKKLLQFILLQKYNETSAHMVYHAEGLVGSRLPYLYGEYVCVYCSQKKDA